MAGSTSSARSTARPRPPRRPERPARAEARPPSERAPPRRGSLFFGAVNYGPETRPDTRIRPPSALAWRRGAARLGHTRVPGRPCRCRSPSLIPLAWRDTLRRARPVSMHCTRDRGHGYPDDTDKQVSADQPLDRQDFRAGGLFADGRFRRTEHCAAAERPRPIHLRSGVHVDRGLRVEDHLHRW